jgi:hypothetical protein
MFRSGTSILTVHILHTNNNNNNMPFRFFDIGSLCATLTNGIVGSSEVSENLVSDLTIRFVSLACFPSCLASFIMTSTVSTASTVSSHKQPWDRFPRIAAAASVLATQLVRGLRDTPLVSTDKQGQFEFESRFVTRNVYTGNLQNGVSQEFYTQSLSMMQECEDWKTVILSQEIRDYYYNVTAQDGRCVSVRTRVEFPSAMMQQRMERASFSNSEILNFMGPSSHDVAPHIQHIVKHKIFTRDFDIVSRPQEDATKMFTGQTDPKHAVLPHRIRGCLNWEETLHPSVIPKSVDPTCVRIIHPTRFLYVNKDQLHPRPIWSYDFAKVWQGKTASEAEDALRTKVPTYEIEPECMDPIGYMKLMHKDEAYVSTSLLLKTCDFLEFFDPPLEHYALVPV